MTEVMQETFKWNYMIDSFRLSHAASKQMSVVATTSKHQRGGIVFDIFDNT